MVRPILLLAAAGVLLSGCATAYQSPGLTGGHYEQKGPGTLELVSFSANGYTKPELAQKYALYRCAERAKAKNKPFFIMYTSLVNAARNVPTDTPHVGLALGKPTATALVLLLDAPRPGAHHTDDVMADLRKVIETGSLNQN